MLNQIVIDGRLGKNPESRTTKSGTYETNLDIANSKRWTNKETGEVIEKTTWVRVRIWGDYAKSVFETLRSGDLITVVGELQIDEYTNPETQERSWYTWIRAQRIEYRQIAAWGQREQNREQTQGRGKPQRQSAAQRKPAAGNGKARDTKGLRDKIRERLPADYKQEQPPAPPEEYDPNDYEPAPPDDQSNPDDF